MNPLDALRSRLGQQFAWRAADDDWAAPQGLARTLAALPQARDRRTDGAPPPRATQALFSFRLNQGPASFLALKQLCACAAKPAGWDNRRLIDDPRLFAALLRQVAALGPDARRFGKCYRLLLGSYFAYPATSPAATAAGRANWQALGDFLRRHLAAVCGPGSGAVKWTTTLREHAYLLDRKSTRLNSSHLKLSRMPSSA